MTPGAMPSHWDCGVPVGCQCPTPGCPFGVLRPPGAARKRWNSAGTNPAKGGRVPGASMLVLFLACAQTYEEEGSDAIVNAFVAAEEQTGVPVEILLALSKVETGVQAVVGVEEFPGQAPAYGVMGLRGDNLAMAAGLAGLDEDAVRAGHDANVLAAASLLGAWADSENIEKEDMGAWAPILARYSGIEDDEAKREYLWYEVYPTLQKGVDVEGIASAPMDASPDYPRPTRMNARTGDSSTVWSASPNYNSRSGSAVDFVIIHACEGSYSGCWSWLTNSSSGVSSHYVVNTDGSEVRQLVDEDSRAWHISANYDCDYNGGVECSRDGTSMNTISVGIEHAGYTSQASWESGLLARSAQVTCGVTDRHGVPRDSYHIVSHGQLQPWNRSDPGSGWPWSSYISAVQAECGDSSSSSSSGSSSSSSSSSSSGSSSSSSTSPTAKSFVIDSNNGSNDASYYWIELSSSWWSSANTSGYYNTGYWVAKTESVSDPASFYFKSDAARCYTVDAYWPAASDRPPSITFFGWDEDGHEVGRATVNQQKSGGQWNTLGSWTFPAGTNRVLLSRWTTGGYYAIADAVRLTPC